MKDKQTPFYGYGPKRMDIELGLLNPYSKITCFLVFLYSMEFGAPPLYAELNRVARVMDVSQILNLGPYARALSVITLDAERGRKSGDKMTPGTYYEEKEGGIECNMEGIFMMYRGASMKEEWLAPYRQNLYNKENG